ncbi:MAG: hypothetical protein ACE5JG_01095, partial [Planctomycetota bacterium]
MDLFALLFPAEPRSFPGRRGVKIVMRAAHVFCAGVLVGAFVLDAAADLRSAWLWVTILSGVLILLLDLHETAAFFCQVRGLVVLGKIASLALLPWLGVWLLGFLLVASVISSHAPATVRHRQVLGG